MGRIHQLDSDTANKIAAGEVVERPANVIKELVENSIDASATKIDVLVRDGGMESMTIIDDGIGMSHEDALMCFSRHATSKIVNDKDLFNITTLGFRGEAIPSIASISKFSLTTNDGNEGSEVIYEFGKREHVGYTEGNRGTKISVEKIFQNVPARLKYMKSVNAEFAAIYTYIERLSLAHPEIAFTLVHNDRQIFHTNGRGKLLEVISDIYGINVARNMVPVEFGNEEFSIKGYISKIDTTRASKNHIITLVNHRYVKNKKSIDAINEVYRDYLSDKRFPIAVIDIEVDPYLVDVNVHPAKLEVRFSKESELKDIITAGIKEALSDKTTVLSATKTEVKKEVFRPTFNLVEEEPIKDEPIYEPVYDQMEFDLSHTVEEKEEPIYTPDPITEEEYIEDTEESSYDEVDVTTETVAVKEPVQEVTKTVSLNDIPLNPIKEKIIAKCQIRGSYIIGENEKGMYLVDQRAASLRINYEKYKKAYSKLDMVMQPLIVPVSLHYTESEFMIIEEHKIELKAVGIELDVMGPQTYYVRELPMWMTNIDATLFIERMIQSILNDEDLDVVELQEVSILSLATQASLKSNTYLNTNDAQVILDSLMRCDNPYVDPKGRPTLVSYSDYELEKIFKKVN